MSRDDNAGLYVHVPFCMTKCLYCDFYSVTSPVLLRPWLQAVRKEALFYRDKWALFDSLYLGGGTPSLLDESALLHLMDHVLRVFRFSSDAEMTMEMNPDDVTPHRMQMLRDFGFNRISLGVQSLQDEELAWLGRRHTAEQAENAIRMIRCTGFKNLGVDLIYGLPGQDRATWLRTLQRILLHKPEHISCYMLTLEDRTPLGRMRAEGKFIQVGESDQIRLFLLTSRFLEEHGYIHYEVSNFARDADSASRHNQKYWNHTPYLGLGPAAHSFRDGVRWWNVSSVEDYCMRIIRGEKPVEGSEILNGEQLQLEAVYLGLRTKRGFNIALLEKNTQTGTALNRLIRSGYLEVRDNRVIPTRRGYLVADRLPMEILS